MLLISRSIGFQKITFISLFCSIDKLLFPTFLIFILFLQLPISSSVSHIIQKLCSLSYSFHLSSFLRCHQEEGNFFSGHDQSNWLFYVRYYLEVSSFSYTLKIFSSLVSFSDHFIFSILLQHYTSNLSKQFRSNLKLIMSIS